MSIKAIILGAGIISFAACGGGDGAGGNTPDAAGSGSDQDQVLTYDFATTKGTFTLETHRSWAPLGVDRFAELVAAHFFDGARFFRVIPRFVAQFGINGTPATNAMWSDKTIADDPVVKTNTRGYVTFAMTSAPDSRTTQLFVNVANNAYLDAMGFAPFALVTDGMDVVDTFDSEYGETPDQEQINAQGNAYLTANFPNLDSITTVTPR